MTPVDADTTSPGEIRAVHKFKISHAFQRLTLVIPTSRSFRFLCLKYVV
jgi:hypothetical protein